MRPSPQYRPPFAIYKRAPAFFDQYMKDMRRPIVAASHLPRAGEWPDTGIHAAWLGHSTVLLKVDGVRILTDPVFSDRAGMHFGLFSVGLKRQIAPALSVAQLPHIDLVLLSHAHMDHLDKPSLWALGSRRTEVVTATGTSDLVLGHRFRHVTELGWNESHQIGPARIQAIEVKHWGARMRTDTWRGYNGYVIEIGRYRILFAGDTADTDSFRAIRRQHRIDLAIMPIGAYDPWIRNHCTPEQAWRMGNDAGAEHFLPVHHKTFALGREPFSEPIERFVAAAGNHPDRVMVRHIGEECHLA